MVAKHLAVYSICATLGRRLRESACAYIGDIFRNENARRRDRDDVILLIRALRTRVVSDDDDDDVVFRPQFGRVLG